MVLSDSIGVLMLVWPRRLRLRSGRNWLVKGDAVVEFIGVSGGSSLFVDEGISLR
jgi:hypothetical protein